MKANYVSINVYAKDLKNYEYLANRVEATLEYSYGYHFVGWDKESEEYLRTNAMELHMEVMKVLAKRRESNES